LNVDSAGRKRTIIKMAVRLILNGEIMMISMSFSGKLVSLVFLFVDLKQSN
jgi:hypothetical protein